MNCKKKKKSYCVIAENTTVSYYIAEVTKMDECCEFTTKFFKCSIISFEISDYVSRLIFIYLFFYCFYVTLFYDSLFFFNISFIIDSEEIFALNFYILTYI